MDAGRKGLVIRSLAGKKVLLVVVSGRPGWVPGDGGLTRGLSVDR
jgi:hypothetical protein